MIINNNGQIKFNIIDYCGRATKSIVDEQKC